MKCRANDDAHHPEELGVAIVRARSLRGYRVTSAVETIAEPVVTDSEAG
jgi:hypothetical protein